MSVRRKRGTAAPKTSIKKQDGGFVATVGDWSEWRTTHERAELSVAQRLAELGVDTTVEPDETDETDDDTDTDEPDETDESAAHDDDGEPEA